MSFSQEDVMDEDAKKPKVKQSGIMNIRGKDVATYPAMIDYAHQAGIQSLDVAVLQYPSDANGMMAICAAKVVKTSGEVFSDIGDASPDNVPKGCMDSFVRIASTRAKSRALSDAFNVRNALESDHGDKPLPISGPVIDVEYVCDVPESQQQGRKSLPGGPSLSSKQDSFIRSSAKKAGLDPEQRAKEMFGKTVEALSVGEADQVIKSFTR
jgi:hypothetical protein